MKVIIPVAGIGSRLRPHTHSAPKSLLYVAGKPILGHILDQVVKLNPSEVIFITGFLGSQIVDYVNSEYKINAKFVEQKELLGLGYAIYLGTEKNQTEDLLIILGDTVIETEWEKIIGQKKNILGVKEVDDPRRFGVVETSGTKITSIVEKPQHPKSNLASVGLYYIHDTIQFHDALSEVLESGVRTRGEVQVTDAFDLLLKQGFELHAYPVKGWHDCGKRETLLETNKHLLKAMPHDMSQGKAPGCVINPPVFIAPNAIIGPNASVADGSVIRNSIVCDSIISSGARVENARLTSSLVGNNAVVNGAFKVLNVGDSSEISY